MYGVLFDEDLVKAFEKDYASGEPSKRTRKLHTYARRMIPYAIKDSVPAEPSQLLRWINKEVNRYLHLLRCANEQRGLRSAVVVFRAEKSLPKRCCKPDLLIFFLDVSVKKSTDSSSLHFILERESS